MFTKIIITSNATTNNLIEFHGQLHEHLSEKFTLEFELSCFELIQANKNI